MFTPREWGYLKKLEMRNRGLLLEYLADPSKEQQANPWDPLEKPMKDWERKIRSSIRKKMSLNARELVCAFQSGMPPEKWLFERRIISLETMIWFFKGMAMLQSIRERADLEEIIGTKYIKFNLDSTCGSAGNIIAKQAEMLRQEFRAQNPELYDEMEKKLDAEREEALRKFYNRSSAEQQNALEALKRGS